MARTDAPRTPASVGVGPASPYWTESQSPKEFLVKLASIGFAIAAVLAATSAPAQRYEPGTGPVAEACQQDIETSCRGKEHGRGEIRACLEGSKAKVSAACAAALDSTGTGSRR
jgi:hypothetical protein